MKTWEKYTLIFTVFVDIYYLIVWTYVFNLYNTHVERISKFITFFLFNVTVKYLNIILLVLSVLSIFIALKNIKRTAWEYLRIFVLILFVCLIMWQSL